MRIIFTRHGESEANVQGIIDNQPPGLALTAAGRDQAHNLAERIDERIDAIYTSPLQRAVLTAQIIADHLGLRYTIDDALIEYHCGILEGRSDSQAWMEHRRTLESWYLHDNAEYAPQGGESLIHIRERFNKFLERAARDHAGTIIAISHGGTLRAGLAHRMPHPYRSFGFARTLVFDSKDHNL